MKQTIRDYGWETAAPMPTAGYLLPPILSFLEDLPVGARILDVGCGNGYLAAQLARKGFSVVGVDSSESGVDIAARTYPEVRFCVATAEGDLLVRLGEEPFDAVVSTEVVEHVYDPHEFASACFQALSTGGRFICSTPYHGYLKNVALAVANRFDPHWHPLHVGGHIKFWSNATLGALLAEAGFVNVRFRGAGRVPLLWKSIVVAAERPSSVAPA
jgi:2-polyprenyl-3-methyl-5-hydroxy-6-metoxy-1,4-benzoquinol methylase